MTFSCILRAARPRNLLFAIFTGLGAMLGLVHSAHAQTPVLNVTYFGARGDAVQFVAATVSNSAAITVQSSNSFSSADVGKLILLFGAGSATTGANNQDLVAQIVSVTNGTNITLSVSAGRTASQIIGTCGTQNAGAFQSCVDACSGTNTIVQVPPGRYLLIPPAQLDPRFTMSTFADARAAVTIRKGGIHFYGADRDSSVLVGSGAWLLKGAWVHRGFMFLCQGPVTNDAPLIFENLTFDGGVQQGRQAYYNAGPALTSNGAGWDVTHDAVVDGGKAPLHAFKRFANCAFVHWRGEMVKSVVSQTDGYIEVAGCSFIDGEGSGFNFNFTHHISGCTFSNLDMAMEFYAGYMMNPSVFETSTITNVRGGIVLVGALTNRTMPSYTINGNSFGPAQFGILLGPARNVTISGNTFFGGTVGVGTDGAAYQGTDCNGNIVINNNTFQQTTPFNVGGTGTDRIENVIVRSNTAIGCARFADGYGWSTNVTFTGNSSSGSPQGTLHGPALLGQWFVDDVSNDFPLSQSTDVTNPTNVLSYANGMRQQTWVSQSNSVFKLDDSHPQQIPTGARLIVYHTGKYPVALRLSTSLASGTPVTMQKGTSAECRWSGSQWVFVSTQPIPEAPQNFRLIGQ